MRSRKRVEILPASTLGVRYEHSFKHNSEMFLAKNLVFVLVQLCMIIVCRAEYNYFEKISSYVRTGSAEIADKISSYYDEYTQTKSVPNVDEESDKIPGYGYFEKISSHVRTGSAEIANKISSYYDEYTQTKSVPNVDEESDKIPGYEYFEKISSYVRAGSVKFADKISSYYDEYTQKKSVPDVDEKSDKIFESAAEDENSCERKLREYRKKMNDIPDETLSRRIVNMILTRARLRTEGSLLRGRVDFEATDLEMDALKNFGLGKTTLREVAPILNSVIKTAEFDVLDEYISSISTLFNFLVTYKDAIIATLAALYLFRILKNTKWNFWMILFIAILISLLLCLVVTWLEILQERNEWNALEGRKKMPIWCIPGQPLWVDKIVTLISSHCQKYYVPSTNNSIVITPKLVFLRTLQRIVWGTVAISNKISSILLKWIIEYLPRMGHWIAQTSRGFPILAILLFALAFFCCNNFLKRHKHSAQKRRLNNSNERQMKSFVETPIRTSEGATLDEAVMFLKENIVNGIKIKTSSLKRRCNKDENIPSSPESATRETETAPM